MFLTRQDGSFRSKAFLGMKRLGILTQRDTLNLFLGMSASERNEWIGEVKERTKMETEPEIERGKENQSPWVQYIHYDKMLGFFFFFASTCNSIIQRDEQSLLIQKRQKFYYHCIRSSDQRKYNFPSLPNTWFTRCSLQRLTIRLCWRLRYSWCKGLS